MKSFDSLKENPDDVVAQTDAEREDHHEDENCKGKAMLGIAVAGDLS